MSDNRSYGSNFHPSSQSRKISIGIMVESSGRRILGSLRDNDVAVPNALGIGVSHKGDLVERVGATKIGQKHDSCDHEGSPWITKRSAHRNSASPEGLFHAKVGGPKTHKDEMHSKPNGLKVSSLDCSFRLSPNQTSDNVGEKRLNCEKRNGERNENAEAVHDCSSLNEKKVLKNAGAIMRNKNCSTVNKQSETLRIKLQELLETVSSPNKENPISQPLDVGVTSPHPNHNINQASDAAVKPKQYSDTIENDSEIPDCSNRRPVTRAFSRKRASTKMQPKEPKCVPSSYKQKLNERNIFTFEEHIGLHGVINGSSKKTPKKYSRIKPHNISFLKCDQEKIHQATDENDNPSSVVRPSSHVQREVALHGFTSSITRDNTTPERISKEKDPFEEPHTCKPFQHEETNSPVFEENREQREVTDTSFLKGHVDQQDDLPSPTFRKTPTATSSPSSLRKNEQEGHESGDWAPVEEVSYREGIFSFKNWASKKLRDGPSLHSEASDVAKGHPRSPLSNSALKTKETDVENSSSESSSEEKDSENSEEEGLQKEEEFSADSDAAEKPKFMQHRIKRLCSFEGIQCHDSNPASGSPKVTKESDDWMQDSVEESREDGFARAIGLLALALEKLKNKVKSISSKKSSEILKNVAERIQIQLQTVETQMQSDMGKLKSLSKQKRKRLETEFQEQEEQLNLIHGNFKKEVNRHLQDFKGTIEGVEVSKTELTGYMEKQNASHRKLLLHVGEVIQAELHDAEKRISDISKGAREQMRQLKLVIENCLEGAVLT